MENLREVKNRLFFYVLDNSSLMLCKIAYFLEGKAAPFFDRQAAKFYTAKMETEAEAKILELIKNAMKNKNIIIRIDEELKNRATAAAAANNTTVTEILTNFLKDYSKDFKH